MSHGSCQRRLGKKNPPRGVCGPFRDHGWPCARVRPSPCLSGPFVLAACLLPLLTVSHFFPDPCAGPREQCEVCGLLGNQIGFVKRDIKKSLLMWHLSLHTFLPLGFMVGVLVCCCLFVIWKVNCTFFFGKKGIGWLNIFAFFPCLYLEEIGTSWKRNFCFNSKKHMQLFSIRLSSCLSCTKPW